jgi:hypothetical protein
MKNNLASLGVFLLIAIALLAFIVYMSKPKLAYSQTVLDTLAQTLAAKGVTMYGAEWCPHCKAEKARFGSSFKYVPYVECPTNEKLCLDKGVKGYPTWITADGQKFEGEQGLEKLAEIVNFDLGKRK